MHVLFAVFAILCLTALIAIALLSVSQALTGVVSSPSFFPDPCAIQGGNPNQQKVTGDVG
jgi:hypothetical protein